MRHVKDRFHVDRKHFVEGRFVDVEHRLVAMRGARVVDDDVGRAEGVDAGLDRGEDVRTFCDIAPHRPRRRAQLGRQLLRFRLLDIRDQDARAFGDKKSRNALAESAGAAGDDRDLAFELSH